MPLDPATMLSLGALLELGFDNRVGLNMQWEREVDGQEAFAIGYSYGMGGGLLASAPDIRTAADLAIGQLAAFIALPEETKLTPGWR